MTVPINASASVERLTPLIETTFFQLRPEASFWLGHIASGEEVYCQAERHGAGVLRANVYIDESHYLPESARQPDGTEYDADDARADHLVVIENNTIMPNSRHVVGNTRLIHKRNDDDVLPIESMFPEAFSEEAAPVGSLEASRYIARHPDRPTQNAIALALVRAMTIRGHNQGHDYIYGVVEDHLMHQFTKIGLPFAALGEPKKVERYNTLNVPLRFDLAEILQTAAADTIGKRTMSLFFQSSGANGGQGYFDRTFIDRVEKISA